MIDNETSEQIVFREYNKLYKLTKSELIKEIIELRAKKSLIEQNYDIMKRSRDHYAANNIRRYEKCEECEYHDWIPEGEMICTKLDNKLCEDVAPCCKMRGSK